MMTTRGLLERLAVVGMALLLIALVGHVTASRAGAQGPSNNSILQAISNLQTSVNALQTSVNNLQNAVNQIPTDPRKRFYLTTNPFAANEALTACDAGFHMASLWEIFDTSNLTYDTNRGFTQADSGSGPPASEFGWIRTGGSASTVNSAGVANCDAWTSDAIAAFGTVAHPRSSWAGEAEAIDPWFAIAYPCELPARVWCLQE